MYDFFNRPVTVPDMMDAREARFFLQQQLLREHPGSMLVCLGMNIAGPIKTTPAIERAFSWGRESILDICAPYPRLDMKEKHDHTGPEMMVCLKADAEEVKRRLCDLEDGTPLGRLLDVDIIRPDGSKVSRTEIGRDARKCLLCDNPAPVCARSRSHSVGDLFARAHQLIAEHFARQYAVTTAARAQQALLTEVAVSPKPGLVDRVDNGAHTDMDVFTFINSAAALGDYFRTCTETGLRFRGGNPADCFEALRTPGLLAEGAMYRATGGINTHKGAIFSLGIFCAALGMGFDGEASDPAAALLRCGEMTAPAMAAALEKVQSGDARSNGERLYKQQGLSGVRGEAAGGFASVRTIGLPMLQRARACKLSVNDSALCVLIALMAQVPDTNIHHRAGENGAKETQQKTSSLLARLEAQLDEGKVDCMWLHSELQQLNSWMKRLRISPGGCADLLAMTLLADYSSSGSV
ncbi:MAG: citrate lyase holo-[acyl-carrier protein] synthase [Clostridia bacterium]|nr:citrate lyase holo-[acyl-carrier protein] synthase [Clostridia bacterium]